jgi:hypothetical protein
MREADNQDLRPAMAFAYAATDEPMNELNRAWKCGRRIWSTVPCATLLCHDNQATWTSYRIGGSG